MGCPCSFVLVVETLYQLSFFGVPVLYQRFACDGLHRLSLLSWEVGCPGIATVEYGLAGLPTSIETVVLATHGFRWCSLGFDLRDDVFVVPEASVEEKGFSW